MDDDTLYDEEAPTPEREEESGRGLDFVADVPLQITVTLGSTEVTIEDLLKMTTGSVLELDKLAGEPLEIKLNQKMIARGEVVTINDKYGIRLTDID